MDATTKITRNLGGDRLGSGAKNNISLHAYNRSTHDLSRAWRSSMMAGTLVPFMVEVGLPGDTWTINLETLVRTMPAVGPMYGSFKLQLDIFECPIRLYNGLLHNNMTKIGLNMAQVKLPKITLSTRMLNPKLFGYNANQCQIASNSLLNYLGLSGIGSAWWKDNEEEILERKFNAVPLLAYWDIYKNYYANKQEEKGVYIKPTTTEFSNTMLNINMLNNVGNVFTWNFEPRGTAPETTPPASIDVYQAITQDDLHPMPLATTDYWLNYQGVTNIETIQVIIYDSTADETTAYDILDIWPNATNVQGMEQIQLGIPEVQGTRYKVLGFGYSELDEWYQNDIELTTFNLANIDQMRIDILQATGLNNELDIATTDYEPYSVYSEHDANDYLLSKYKACGLGIKTYQSDMFQNWLQTEWIDGVNGINSITAIDTSSGSFTIDALNLANKVYNMLNRIAVSGGSYEDFIESVYTIETARRAESPVYKGGMSAEIVFEEVVSTNTGAETDALGTLAGKGTQAAKRGGHIEIKCDEPSFIMGIVSITPRIDYSQGNKWYLTDLDTLDDLHKPALDGIGFQDLLQEQMAWWGTVYDDVNQEWVRFAAGKIPAWMNYMTSYNETHGDFAEEGKTMYMTLNRRYEMNRDRHNLRIKGIEDLTTYIDPTKYNYAFADTSLAAENFWVQIGIEAIARRVMSAKVIPSL